MSHHFLRLPAVVLLVVFSTGCDSGGSGGRLEAPIPHLPLDNATSRERVVSFDWQPVEGAAYYEVDVQPTTSDLDGRTSFTVQQDEAEVTFDRASEYEWKVRAVAGTENGAWNTPRRLTVGASGSSGTHVMSSAYTLSGASAGSEDVPVEVLGGVVRPASDDSITRLMLTRGTVRDLHLGAIALEARPRNSALSPNASAYLSSVEIQVVAPGMVAITVAASDGTEASVRNPVLNPEADLTPCLFRDDCEFVIVAPPIEGFSSDFRLLFEATVEYETDGVWPTW